MSNSLSIPHGAEAALPSLRWPLVCLIAAAIELTFVVVALDAQSSAPSKPEPQVVKVARLVNIAEEPAVPQPPAPVPPAPVKRAEPPRPAAKPAPSPVPAPAPVLPAPAADTAPPQPAPDNAAKHSQVDPVPAPVTPPLAKPAQPTGVRRGLVPLQRVEPDYPPRALAANTEGVVTAHVTIEKDGSVSAVNIVSAQPPKIFDQAAIRALSRWKFAQNDGGMVGEIELRFNLN